MEESVQFYERTLSLKRLYRFGDHWAPLQVGKGRASSSPPIRNDGTAGKFASFEDPDGNSTYLAELKWNHVDQGEGAYPKC
jgi:hypothetical protein